MTWDIFISHASEDKERFVRPLVANLVERGLSVWYDERTLKVGQGLRESIDQGMASSRFGVIILSRHFLKKDWPRWELDGLLTERLAGKKTILPIWLDVTVDEIRSFSPSLANVVAAQASWGLERVTDAIITAIKADTAIEEIRPPTLMTVAKFVTPWISSRDPYGLEALLRGFTGANSLFQLLKEGGENQHEWGYGGHRDTRYQIQDIDKNVYLLVEMRENWDTTSDDSMDNEQPTVISIQAVRPLFGSLSTQIVRLLSAYSIKE